MKKSLFIILIAIFAITACGSKRKVSRKDTGETIDLSGYWNDTDSRLVAEEMMKDCLAQPWYEKAKKNNKNEVPRVIVGTVKNKSHEHIATETFTKDLERSLLNSGAVDFVADSSQREALREERKEQATYASDATQQAMGEELGAQFMVQGQINSILDSVEGQQVRFYQVELEMIDIKTNRKVWIGQKKIKKLVEQSGHSF